MTMSMTASSSSARQTSCLQDLRVQVLGEGPLEVALHAALQKRGADVVLDADSVDVVVALTPPQKSLGTNGILSHAMESVEAALDAARKSHAPLLWTSTLQALGNREGLLVEGQVAKPPYPNAHRQGAAHWNVEAEIRTLIDLDAGILARVDAADQRSLREHTAKAHLDQRREPVSGTALHGTLAESREKQIQSCRRQVADERARTWGFCSAPGYAAALAEQRVAMMDDVTSTVVRLSDLSSSLDGEIFADALLEVAEDLYQGQRRFALAEDATVEILPVCVAADALCVAVAALARDQAPPLIHVGTSDRAPLRAARFVDLVDLAWRHSTSPTQALVKAPVDAITLGAPVLGARGLVNVVKRLAKKTGPLNSALDIVTNAIEQRTVGESGQVSLRTWPFIDVKTRLRARALERVERRLHPSDRNVTWYAPTNIDWRRYLLDVHLPALFARVDDDKAHQTSQAHRAYDHLPALLRGCAERSGKHPALTLFAGEQTINVSYRELYARALAVTDRLQRAGVVAGDRVLLSGDNHPDWPIAAFGVLLAGAVLVPIDPTLDADAAAVVAKKARLRFAIVDKKARASFGVVIDEEKLVPAALDLHLVTVSGPAGTEHTPQPDDVASILFTSGTTGTPKGVMLSHRNFTSLIGSLSTVFEMRGDDRSLSVLPLHHTLEFSCGLLLPLVAGARIHYLDALTGERLIYALNTGRITGMVGVPALWQLLERRLKAQVEERGQAAKRAVEMGMQLNRVLGKKTGLDAGRLLFRPIHDELGGHLRTLISGGAALPPSVQETFAGLGLHLAEGYGLTETAPVLSVAQGGPGQSSGHVGPAIPDVELRIDAPDDIGVGEVLAKGPNIMQGYFENPAATTAAFTDDGWFRTGDLGRLDENGTLTLVGRAKDVVVTAAGENIYLDDVEARLGEPRGAAELSLLGIPDPRGGERLALAAVAEENCSEVALKEALAAAIKKLPDVMRPSVIEIFTEPLPRTATRKVKRKALVSVMEERLEKNLRNRSTTSPSGPAIAPVRAAVALVAGVEVGKVTAALDLRGDLGFDSLMWVELQAALEPLFGAALDADALFACETIADVEAFLRKGAPAPGRSAKNEASSDEDAVQLPGVVVAPTRAALGFAQRELYQSLLQTKVEGHANIPQNRPCIVVSNHTSHLDTGLVKMALGPYGRSLAPLAAKDYFFEGNPLKVAFFKQLTNLVPIERESGSGAGFQQAVDVVEQGQVVLIFPEGTRRTDGTLGGFKPLVGRLSLRTERDVLPMHLEGAYDVLPKGARMFRGRQLRVRIGPPLLASDLRRLTAHLPPVTAARAATAVVRQAVAALRDGQPLVLDNAQSVDESGRITWNVPGPAGSQSASR